MKKWIWNWVKVLVSACILVYLCSRVELAGIREGFERFSWGPVIYALLLFELTQLVSSGRFVYIMEELGGKLPYWTSVRAHYIGLWFNQVMPTGFGGDVVKVLLLRKDHGLGRVTRAALLDRISGLAFLMMSLVILLPLYQHVLKNTHATVAIGAAGSAFLSGLAFLTVFGGKQLRSTTLRPPLDHMLEIVYDLRRLSRTRALARQLWTSGIVHLNGIAAYALIGHAMGLPIGFEIYLALVPLVFLVSLIPISFAGWGLRETGAVGLFSLVGIREEDALAVSILFGLLLVVASLPGGLLWIFDRSRHET